MSKTRNQRRRAKEAALTGVVVAMAVVAGVLFVKALDHPGEQHISGEDYMAEVAQYGRQTAIDVKSLPIVEEP